MSLLQEVTLDRLSTKYRARFGHPPPFTVARLDEAVEHMRRELAERTREPPAPAGQPPRKQSLQ
jgi:hypothetical protein